MFNVHIPITSFRDPCDLQWGGCVMALLTHSMFNGPMLPPLTQPAGSPLTGGGHNHPTAFSLST